VALLQSVLIVDGDAIAAARQAGREALTKLRCELLSGPAWRALVRANGRAGANRSTEGTDSSIGDRRNAGQ